MTKNLLKIASILFILHAFFYSGTLNVTTDSDFSSGTLTSCDVVGTGSNGTLQLQTNTASYFGCTSKADSASTYAVFAAQWASVRFTSTTTQTIDKVMLLVTVDSLSAASYDIDFYDDNGSGDPGAFLGTAAITNSSLSIGAQWVTVDISDCALTAGLTYHIVVKENTAVALSTDCLRVYYSNPKTGLWSNDNSQDILFGFFQSINAGGTWTDSSGQPVFGLLPVTGAKTGNVYYTSATNLSVFGNSYHGERINVTGASKVASKVGFYIKVNSAVPPADHLYAVLYCITDGVEIESVKLADKNDVTPDYEWYSANFSRPRVLETGKSYRVYIKSPSSTGANFYQAYRVEATLTNSDVDSLTYDGTNSLYAEYTTGSWVENVDNTDLVFRLTAATYETSGNFASNVLDAGGTASFNTLSWLPASQPSGTTLRLQLASSSSDVGPWNYYGPDGTATTYYTVSGQTISPVHSGKRYMCVKSLLDSTSNTTTPVVNSIAIDYSSRALPGTILQMVCSPVPFTPGGSSKLAINYILTTNSTVKLKIYSLTGDLVKEYNCVSGIDGGRGDTSGYNNKVEWDGRNGDGMNVASGVYLVRITVEPEDGTAKVTDSKKIMVLR